MILVSKNPLIVEMMYDGVFNVKVVLCPLFDKKIIEYIENNNLEIGTDIEEHQNSTNGL